MNSLQKALMQFRLNRLEMRFRAIQNSERRRLTSNPSASEVLNHLQRSGKQLVDAIDNTVAQTFADAYNEQLRDIEGQLRLEGVNARLAPQRTNTELLEGLYDEYPSFYEKRGYKRLRIEDKKGQRAYKSAIRAQIEANTHDGNIAWRIVFNAMLLYQLRRARANARTNVRRAQEYAKHLCCEDLNKNLGIPTEKEWDSVLIETTRDAHEIAHGQRVPIEGYFDVGGERLRFPLDQKGSARNIINCLCSVRYRVKRPTGGWRTTERRIRQQSENMRRVVSTRSTTVNINL